jgi:hypothetical protein
VQLAPAFWAYTLRVLLGLEDEHLIAEIWERFPKSQALLYLLARCETPSLSLEITRQRVQQFAYLVEPRYLLGVVEAMTKERPTKPPELVLFEERLLALLDASGSWKWE